MKEICEIERSFKNNLYLKKMIDYKNQIEKDNVIHLDEIKEPDENLNKDPDNISGEDSNTKFNKLPMLCGIICVGFFIYVLYCFNKYKRV